MKKKILVFDDDESIVDVLSIILKEEGYLVLPATNGEDALSLIIQNRPDLILLDIMMSGMDGRIFSKKIKRIKGVKSIPIIIISANAKTESIAREIKAVDFIIKPFELSEVIEKVKKACG